MVKRAGFASRGICIAQSNGQAFFETGRSSRLYGEMKEYGAKGIRNGMLFALFFYGKKIGAHRIKNELKKQRNLYIMKIVRR